MIQIVWTWKSRLICKGHLWLKIITCLSSPAPRKTFIKLHGILLLNRYVGVYVFATVCTPSQVVHPLVVEYYLRPDYVDFESLVVSCIPGICFTAYNSIKIFVCDIGSYTCLLSTQDLLLSRHIGIMKCSINSSVSDPPFYKWIQPCQENCPWIWSWHWNC